MILLCKDCRHFGLDDAPQCNAPGNVIQTELDYVTGEKTFKKYVWMTAQYCRTDEKACSPEGRWFELKAPL